MALNSPISAWNYQTQTGTAVQPGAAGNDARRANPNWNATVISHVGYSNSTSFQAQLQHRFSNGLSFQWFYIYNHILTTTDEGGFSDGVRRRLGAAEFRYSRQSEPVLEPEAQAGVLQLRLGSATRH